MPPAVETGRLDHWSTREVPRVNFLHWTSLVAQMVKNLPAMQKTWVRSLGPDDPLEKEMATHSSVLAWRIPWREEPGCHRAGHD